MKIAIVHDYLCEIAGSERIFQYFCEEFSEADAYVLAYNSRRTLPYFTSRKIHTTWLNFIVRSRATFNWMFPLSTYVMEGVDLRSYDVVLSSSATVAKYVKVPNGKHICYCYIPTRALWHTDVYFGRGLLRLIVKLFLPYLQKRDLAAAKRVDSFVAISKDSQAYIKKYYNRDSAVINCPIDMSKFTRLETHGSHFLIVSRLERWKKVDYAIEAFNSLGLPLTIVGTGGDQARLKAMARDNISFLGSVDDRVLAREYASAAAVIFTPFLEYGLTPLESNASGTPVICYGKGGVTETMIPWSNSDSKDATAIFFFEQNADALKAAVVTFKKETFYSDYLVRHASQWSVPNFKKRVRVFVTNSVQDFNAEFVVASG